VSAKWLQQLSEEKKLMKTILHALALALALALAPSLSLLGKQTNTEKRRNILKLLFVLSRNAEVINLLNSKVYQNSPSCEQK